MFPTGKPISPRWRFVPVGAIVAATAWAVMGMVTPGPVGEDEVQVENPLGIDALADILDVLGLLVAIAILFLTIAAVVSLVIRFRRSTGEERQQIRWFAYATLLAVVLFAPGAPPGGVAAGPRGG